MSPAFLLTAEEHPMAEQLTDGGQLSYIQGFMSSFYSYSPELAVATVSFPTLRQLCFSATSFLCNTIDYYSDFNFSPFIPNSSSKMIIRQTRNIGLPMMNLIRFNRLPILKQLRLEEKLLRMSSENWCIINDGTVHPTIVMGVSGKPVELLEIESVLRDQVPVIRRFTGGGTVIVDQGTVFVTFICNKDAVPGLQPYPRPITSWSSLLYSKVFHGNGDFHLRENDYVFGNHKFGGNAQSITKSRWIHHTSFLWDFEVRNMTYLKLPKRAPAYRSARDHLDFICRIKDYMRRSAFIDKTEEATRTHFSLRPFELKEIETFSKTEFSPSTRLLTEEELEAAIVAAQ